MKCLLNIWGVMLFLRLTWVIGQAGVGKLSEKTISCMQIYIPYNNCFIISLIVNGIIIIVVCNVITIVTGISMSAVSTNGQIKAGNIIVKSLTNCIYYNLYLCCF
jgi:hypothetical protein